MPNINVKMIEVACWQKPELCLELLFFFHSSFLFAQLCTRGGEEAVVFFMNWVNWPSFNLFMLCTASMEHVLKQFLPATPASILLLHKAYERPASLARWSSSLA